MTTAIARLAAGSSQAQPNHSDSAPATTTPADTSASPAMCTKALRMFRSSSPPRMNSSAVPRLMKMPMPATTITVTPWVGSGALRRPMASQASEPIATSSSSAFANAARMDARFQP